MAENVPIQGGGARAESRPSSLVPLPSSQPIPPTAEQLESWLHDHPIRPPSPWLALTPLITLITMGILILTVRAGPWMVVPWGILIGVYIAANVRVRRTRSVEQRLAAAQELVMLRRTDEAMRVLWRLVPAAAAMPEAYGRTVALLGHNLDQLRAYDAAIVAYDFLIERLPADHLGAVQLRAQRTIAELMTDRLADADDSLRRLRSWAEGQASTSKGPVILSGPTITTATVRLAQLIQQSRTHHDADAVEEGKAMLDDLRPLGVEAAYGHALLALSNYRLHQNPPPVQTTTDEPGTAATPADRLRDAKLWWSRATLLMPADTLLARFGELSALTADPEMQQSTAPPTPWYRRLAPGPAAPPLAPSPAPAPAPPSEDRA